MTVEEDRLARWLNEGTPEPPIALQADAIVRRALRIHRRRTWVPTVAAACVVLLVALLVTAVTRRHQAAPLVRTAAPTVSSTSSPTPTTLHRHQRPEGLGVRPWHARILSRLSILPDSMIAVDGHLFAVQDGKKDELVRLDPSTGQVDGHAASAVIDDVPSPPVEANGLVWELDEFASGPTSCPSGRCRANAERARYRVVGVDPATMRVAARTAAVPSDTLVRSAGGRLLVSWGRHIQIDPTSAAGTKTLTAPRPLRDIALSPDGSTVYEVTGPQIDSTVSTQDVASGRVTSTTDIGSAANSLIPTGHGFFFTESSGNAAQAEFFPDGHSQPRVISNGGGGVDPEIHLSGGIAWAGGPDTLACVDPSTGRIRAQVDTGGYKAAITGLTALGGRLYAVYHGYNAGPPNALIEMTPPKACGLS